MYTGGKIQLEFTLDGETNLTILCNNKEVSKNNFSAGNHKINFEHELQADTEIKIIKTGVLLLKNKKVSNQIMEIKKLNVNGINCLEGKPGRFDVIGNPYVKDHHLETDKLYLDGVWRKKLTYFNYFTEVDYSIGDSATECQPPFRNVDIALFGASFLANAKPSVDVEKRWFHKTAKFLNCTYQAYSIPGGSNQQIFSLYNAWQKNCRSKIIVFAPTSFSRLSMKLAGYSDYSVYSVHDNLTKLLRDDIDQISSKSVRQITETLVWSGLEQVVALQIPLLYDFFSKIDKKTKVYIMPSVFAERKFFSETKLNKFVLPEWDYNQSRQNNTNPYPSALENQQYFEKLKKSKILDQMKNYI